MTMIQAHSIPLRAGNSDEPHSHAETTLQRILKASPQDLWLDTIRRTRPEVHDSLIYWMLSQTECDFAIAAHAFYRNDPAKHLDVPKPLPLRPGPEDHFALVLLNWDKGYYRTHTLEATQRDIPTRAVARLNQKIMARPRGSLPFTIPARFLDPAGGRQIDLPAHLSPDNASHLWPIYAELGLKVPRAAPGLSRRVAKAKRILHKVSFRTRRS